LFPMLRRWPDLAVAAGGAALTALTEIERVDIDILESIAIRLPADEHVDLDVAAAAISAILYAHRLSAAVDPAERAKVHAGHARRLANAGRNEEALRPAALAVDEYLRLAKSSPDTARTSPGWRWRR
jgi:hypothetical protein